MSPEIHLLIHNIASVISIISALGFALFIYLNNKRSSSNILMSLVFVCGAIFALSHLIGVNVSDPEISRNIFRFNAFGIFIVGALQVHATYSFTGLISKDSRFVIGLFYVVSILLTIIFIIKIDLFFGPSIPKMYFPLYYVDIGLGWIREMFLFGAALPFCLYLIFKKIKSLVDMNLRHQYRYFVLMVILGYGFAFIPNFLVHNIFIDPAIGMIFSIAAIIPAIYGAVKYELFSVKVIAKQAVLYSIAVVVMGGIITVFNYSDKLIRSQYAAFPVWTIPLLSAIVAVTVGVVVWRNLREGDIMKSEFISVVTHKFRTPLTHIKWASENLVSTGVTPDQNDQLKYIQSANEKLVELTDLLVNVSGTEQNQYLYKYEKVDLSSTAKEIYDMVRGQFESKKFDLHTQFAPNLTVNIDVPRIKFIMQTFLENAIHYTSENSIIEMRTTVDGENAIFSITDNGIGIPQDELSLLFKKFYRGRQARLSDTEGMGIALFMSKTIIERHNGKIWAFSKGPNTGSTFAFSIPLAKS